ncbi:unnamed protein product [Paramecium sonneborni]|uniref:Uncharacterized protein n=1 Tax=Paramecium sonneborni TaxID=65129 RepID=A0A8S1RFK5_9CILI|nr:unnamed protein product [Paramecium sonneborni]
MKLIQHKSSRYITKIYNLFTLALLLNKIQNILACPFNNYKDAIMNSESQTWMKILPENEAVALGFWTFSIPLFVKSENSNVGQEFKIDEPSLGEFLFLLRNTENNEHIIVGYNSFDYIQQKVHHIFRFKNSAEVQKMDFHFECLQYEGKWIFHLIILEKKIQKIMIKVNQQEEQSTNFNFENQLNLGITIGGKGYINNLNLNYFKGVFTELIYYPIIAYQESLFQKLMNYCKIPQKIDKEQIINIIQGLKIFKGDQVLQLPIDHYGNNYCLQGWVKYKLKNINEESQILIKITGLNNFEQEKILGDELFRFEVYFSRNNPEQTQIIVNADAYGMPIQQSFQSQHDLFFQGSSNSKYDVIQAKKIYKDLQSQNYFEGLQQWHYIQYEYGRNNLNERMLLMIKFSNELGLLKDNLGNDIFSGSFRNYKFNLFFGGDNLNNNIINHNFLNGNIYDFKFYYNYNEDKAFMQNCHYSCLTCNGPQEQNCLTCDPNSNRYYQEELNMCKCYSEYLDKGIQICDNQFDSSIILEEQQINLEISCPLGYFRLPNNKGNEYDCIECPSQIRMNSIQCIDCLLYPKTWYLKPVCKLDYKQVFSKYNDETLIMKERIPMQYDVYLIGNDQQLHLHTEYEDYCEYTLDVDVYCHKIAQSHLGTTATLKCKYNYLYDMDNYVCLKSKYICKTYDISGYCINCLSNMYLIWYYCTPCPNTCSSCQNNGLNQALCQSCISQYTIKNGQCLKCGINCEICEDSYNESLNYHYLKCLKCIDPSLYLFSLDGINCIQNTIQHCKYAFQTLIDDFTINSLDINFNPQFDQSKITLLCAKCESNYLFVFENQSCVYYDKNDQCEIGIGQLKNSDQSLELTLCLKSNQYQNQVVEFIQNCNQIIDNCYVCLETNIQNYFICLECLNGYYSEQISGKCVLCPIELQCMQCYSQNSIVKDYWKKEIRAFYRKYIEIKNIHQYIQNAQSQNVKDYEIICSSCQDGYKLYKNKCLKYCTDSCLECLFQDDQYICIRCIKNEKGRQQSLLNNECIDCPENCQLCKPRTQLEIKQINPLFNSTKYLKYTNQCIKSYNDQHYYYDEDLSLFVECQLKLNKDGCFKQIIIQFNLYPDQSSYLNDLNLLQDEQSRIEFKKINKYLKDINSFDHLFSEYENDDFYTLANKKQIKSIIIKIIGLKNARLIVTGVLSHQFSINIFSVINIELVFEMQQGTVITIKEVFQFSNFNKITLINIIFDSCKPCIEQKKLIFESVFPQIITFEQITIQQIWKPYYFDYLLIEMKNVQSFFANSLKFISFGLRVIDNFFTIYESNTIKTIIFQDLEITNCQFYDQTIFNLGLKQDDLIEFNNVKIQNTTFNNVSFIYVEYLNQIGIIKFNNSQITSFISDCKTFLSLQYFREVVMINFHLTKSIITNSTILVLNNKAFLEEIIFTSNTFNTNSMGIININQLSNLEYNYLFQNIQFENNQYSSIIKFIKLNKYQSQTQRIKIDEIKIINNYLTDETLNYNQQQNDSSLVLIQFEDIYMTNFFINRGFGLSEFSLQESKILQIINGEIKQDKFNFLGLHQNLNCQLRYVNGQFYPLSIFIGSFQNVFLQNITVSSTSSYNFPIIQIQSALLSQTKNLEKLILDGINFLSNLLILTDAQLQICLIQINSLQEILIQLNNLQFIQNVLHEYDQDDLIKQNGMLSINCPNCQIILQNSIFVKNIVTNSSGTILSINSKSLELKNNSFESNNIFNYSILQPHILWGFSQLVTYETINQIFRVKSLSGNGMFWVQTLNILNNSFQNSVGQQGGCFSIFAQRSSNIIIQNNQFFNFSTQFYQEIEQGGVIYIDGSSVTSLQILIQNIKVQNINCRQYGGFLYLKSNKSLTNLHIINMILKDVYAQQGSVIFTSYSRLVEDLQTIFISGLQIINSHNGYFQFLNKFTMITDNFEKYYLINNRTSIYVEYGSEIIIQNVSVYYLILESFFNSQNIRNITIDTIIIENSYISNQLMFINPLTYIDVTIRLRNIKIELINIGFEFQNLTCLNSTFRQSDTFYECPIEIQQAPKQLSSVSQINESNGFCFYNSIKKELDLSHSGLIFLKCSTFQCQVEIVEIYLRHIFCDVCNFGLISTELQESIQIQFKIQLINKIRISNSNCGEKGCIVVQKTQQVSNLNYNEQQNSSQYELQISNYICIENIGYNGTCLYLNQIKTQIINSNFQSNNASNNGGALYILGQQPLIIENTIITDNRANIGGGLYLLDQFPIDYKKTNTIVFQNYAILYSNNIASIPEKLSIRLKNDLSILNTTNLVENSSIKIDEIKIQPFYLINGELSEYIKLPSGQPLFKYQFYDWKNQLFVESNIIFRIQTLSRDMTYNEIPQIEQSSCLINSRVYNISKKDQNQEFTNNYTNYNEIKFNRNTSDYNLDDLIIYFNNEVANEIVLQLEFSCNSIKVPVFNEKYPYNVQSYHNDYKLRINIKTYDCQFGEIKNITKFSCDQCDSTIGLFSLTLNAQKCDIKDEISTIATYQNQLQLRGEYWRPYFDTKQISYCINLPMNCNGGWNQGDKSCLQGHLGALCEQCDLYDIRGDGSFSVVDKYLCGTCRDKEENLLIIVGVIIMSMIFIFITVSGNIKTVELHTKALPFKSMRISNYLNKAQSGILIKMLTNYLQIIVTITTFQLHFPQELNSTILAVGNPLQTVTYSLDCFLVDLIFVVIQYSRMIWQIIMPLLYINFFIGFYLIAAQFKLTFYNSSVLTTTLIYVYLYFSPNLIDGLVQLISYREISGYKWIQANVSERYDTRIHLKWMMYFCLPFLLILGIFIPCQLFYILYKNRKNLDQRSTRLYWGYLYHEYKREAYFWELIKILQKELIILSLIYYEDSIAVKGILVLFITYLYQELNSNYKPYTLSSLNKLDYYSANICMITISLAIGAYISQQSDVSELQILFYFLMALFNFFFLYKIITKIITEYSKTYEWVLDKIKESLKSKFPNLKNSIHFRNILKNKAEEKQRVYRAFRKLRVFGIPLAKRIIEQKTQSFENFKRFKIGEIIDSQGTLKVDAQVDLLEPQRVTMQRFLQSIYQ